MCNGAALRTQQHLTVAATSSRELDARAVDNKKRARNAVARRNERRRSDPNATDERISSICCPLDYAALRRHTRLLVCADREHSAASFDNTIAAAAYSRNHSRTNDAAATERADCSRIAAFAQKQRHAIGDAHCEARGHNRISRQGAQSSARDKRDASGRRRQEARQRSQTAT